MGWMTGVSGIDLGGGTECLLFSKGLATSYSGVPRGAGGGGFQNPSEIPRALQKRAKLNMIVKTVKNC